METDEEEQDLEEILVEEEEDEDIEVETEGMAPLSRLPVYVSPQKGRERVPKDLDEIKRYL